MRNVRGHHIIEISKRDNRASYSGNHAKKEEILLRILLTFYKCK